MIVNLGLVELGGLPIDDFEMDGYVFRFVDTNPTSGDIRTWYNLKKITGYYEHKHAEIRVFVNHDSPECLALAVKWLTLLRDDFESISLLFNTGNIIIIKK